MLDMDSFKRHLTGKPDDKAEPAKPVDDEDDDKTETGMGPGEQTLAAIKSGDASAFEEAIKRCVKSDY